MQRMAFLSLIVLSFVLAFSLQGVRGIWQPDEGYYVGVSVQMHHEGQYLIPRLNEEIFLDKPPMLYWGIVSGMKLFGQSEFAVGGTEKLFSHASIKHFSFILLWNRMHGLCLSLTVPRLL